MYSPPTDGVIAPVSNSTAAAAVASRLTALEADHAAVIRSLNDLAGEGVSVFFCVFLCLCVIRRSTGCVPRLLGGVRIALARVECRN